MDLALLFKRVEKLTVDNSPLILTAIGVAGVVGTAYLTGKASLKAANIIRDEQFQHNIHQGSMGPLDLTKKDKVKLVWKLYVPPVASGVLTIAAVIAANRVSTSRATALAAAYTISEKAYQEYQEKVVDRIGPNKEQSVRDEMARDKMRNDPVSEKHVIITDGGEHLCYDAFAGRYFKSSMETIRKAENDINLQLIHDGYASLSEFYDKIGLGSTSVSEEVGWTTDHPLEVGFSTILSDDGRPCIAIDFKAKPIRGYDCFG